MNKLKIKKGDQVLIISGKAKGKQGAVQKVLPKKHQIFVTGVNIAKHHLKPSRKNPHGGIIDMVAPIDISNAVIICPRCMKPTRVSYQNREKLTKSGALGHVLNAMKA
jgi:large subunit ribosomal protein L24